MKTSPNWKHIFHKKKEENNCVQKFDSSIYCRDTRLEKYQERINKSRVQRNKEARPEMGERLHFDSASREIKNVKLNDVHRGAFICSRRLWSAKVRGDLVANVDSHDGVPPRTGVWHFSVVHATSRRTGNRLTAAWYRKPVAVGSLTNVQRENASLPSTTMSRWNSFGWRALLLIKTRRRHTTWRCFCNKTRSIANVRLCSLLNRTLPWTVESATSS